NWFVQHDGVHSKLLVLLGLFDLGFKIEADTGDSNNFWGDAPNEFHTAESLCTGERVELTGVPVWGHSRDACIHRTLQNLGKCGLINLTFLGEWGNRYTNNSAQS